MDMVVLFILLANHRDAIAYGFIEAIIDVFPNGELEVEAKFYSDVFSQYLTKRGRAASDDAAADYESYFPWIEQSKDETTVGDENALNEFDNVFAPEFGFSVHLLFRALDEFRKMAVKTDQPGGKVTEDMMQTFLRASGFKPHEAEAFLRCFTLPIRSAWNRDLPPRCRDYDVFPWRFRRQLSLNVRPLVQVSLSPRAWVVSVPVFEKSVTYVLGHLENARFPQDFFHSDQMQQYIGNVTNKRGHDFAEKVSKVFAESGCSTQLEVQVTQLGASKKLRLGDVDVLSWEETTGRVYAVECKRLLTANSVREVVQRLEDFRGDMKKKDSLGRHCRRVEWLKNHIEALAKFTGIPTAKVHLIPMLVTSEIVPMQFYKEMNFPTSQVLSFDELPARLLEDLRK
jgi:hypothetical protein